MYTYLSIPETLIPIIAIIFGCSIPIVAIIVSHLQKKEQMNERKLMIEKGLTPPPIEENNSSTNSDLKNMNRGISLIAVSLGFIFGFIFIFMQQIVRGFSPPVIQDYTNKHLSPKRRATLVSIQSFAGSLLFAVTAPFYGYIADKTSLRTALLATALTFFVAFIILMLWNSRRKK